MAYFNYHATASRLIAEGHLTGAIRTEDWHGIKPALVLFFDNHRPMPVRIHRFHEYVAKIERAGITIGEDRRGN